MAKSKSKTSVSRGRAAAKAAAKTASTKRAAQAPASSDIRQAYKKSLLGKYLGEHRSQPAIKPKK